MSQFDENSEESRLRRTDLREFYDSVQNSNNQFTDINSKHFDQDLYVNNVIQHKNLKQLLEEESELVNNIQRLDSECQTLVYDHYDKFIAATDVVRQMKEGSAEMNAQVSNLQEKMAKITNSSELISNDLQGRRGKLNHLLGIHSTLKKLQFLFHLPQKIDECIKEKKFSEGVQCYVETAEVLQKYQHLPSFSAIHKDCQEALEKLNCALKNELAVNESSAQHLTMCVDLLLQLGEPSEGLCDDFLKQMRTTLEKDLVHLTKLIENPLMASSLLTETTGDRRRKSESVSSVEEDIQPIDILQFIDICHDTFVANLWLVISSYKEMFVRTDGNEERRGKNLAIEKLQSFVVTLVDDYLKVVNTRVAAEDDDSQDYCALTTALDKFHRRLHAIGQLMNNVDFTQKSLQLVYEAGESRCKASLTWLQESFMSNLTDVRQVLATLKPSTKDHSPSTQMNEQLTHLVASTAANIKDRIGSLLVFVQPKNTFAMTSDFRHRFSRELVREGVIISFFKYITETLHQFCNKKEKNPSLLLLLSKMCLDLHTSTVHYLLNYCDEQLQLEDKRGLTPYATLTSVMKETGQKLLDHYVTSQGSSISQMLRRSVELKDWLGCSEPRSVRRVMKTVVEEVSLADVLVGALYEEGTRKDRSSDSSRRTFHGGLSRTSAGGTRPSAWSSYNSGLDTSFMANLNKLWSEKIEIFAPVEFTRISILTGIIKISLKTLLECVRLQTFGRFGFHQVQIDIQYLRTYLWTYVMDEQILNALLDEVLTSASLRTTDPEVMDLKLIEFICEQN